MTSSQPQNFLTHRRSITRAELRRLFPAGSSPQLDDFDRDHPFRKLTQELLDSMEHMKFPDDLEQVAHGAAAYIVTSYYFRGQQPDPTPKEGFMIAVVPEVRFSSSPTAGIRPEIYKQADHSWWEDVPIRKPKRHGSAFSSDMSIVPATTIWSNLGQGPFMGSESALMRLPTMDPSWDEFLLTDKGLGGEQYRYLDPTIMPPTATSKSVVVGREYFNAGQAVRVDQCMSMRPPPGFKPKAATTANHMKVPSLTIYTPGIAAATPQMRMQAPAHQTRIQTQQVHHALPLNYDPSEVSFIMIENPPILPSMSDLVRVHVGRAGQYIMRMDPRNRQVYACIPRVPYLPLPLHCDHCAMPPRKLLNCDWLCRYHAYYAATGQFLSVHEARVLQRMDRRGLVLSIRWMVHFVALFRFQLSRVLLRLESQPLNPDEVAALRNGLFGPVGEPATTTTDDGGGDGDGEAIPKAPASASTPAEHRAHDEERAAVGVRPSEEPNRFRPPRFWAGY